MVIKHPTISAVPPRLFFPSLLHYFYSIPLSLFFLFFSFSHVPPLLGSLPSRCAVLSPPFFYPSLPCVYKISALYMWDLTGENSNKKITGTRNVLDPSWAWKVITPFMPSPVEQISFDMLMKSTNCGLACTENEANYSNWVFKRPESWSKFLRPKELDQTSEVPLKLGTLLWLRPVKGKWNS